MVLLDEIEKAHPEVFNVLLQILEDGRLTDAKGRVVSFKNTILIMTSNVGSKYISEMGEIGFLGEDQREDNEAAKEKIREALRDRFRPEFLNRVDEIIIFNQLDKDELREIVDLEILKVKERLEEKDIELEFTSAAKDLLTEEGYNPKLGARPLKRVIQRKVLDPLALEMISGAVNSGDKVTVRSKKDELILDVKKVRKKAKAKAMAS